MSRRRLCRRGACAVVCAAVLPCGPTTEANVQDTPVEVRVTATELASEPIDPMIYGNFIESGFGHQVDRMWGELLWNRSFEEITPLKSPVWDWLARRPEDDLSAEDWWHSGYEEDPWYLQPGNPDASFDFARWWDFHHGLQAARVRNRSRTQPAYLVQDGIHLRRGVALEWSGALRAGPMVLPEAAEIELTVGLYPEGEWERPLASSRLTGVGSAWKQYARTLENPDHEGRASLVVEIPPGGDVRLDGFSLMPADAVHGWRRDVIDALRRVRPPILRFPGGCYASFYRWRDGIGPPQERRPRKVEYWGGLEPNDVGTAEFVTLCRLLDAEPFLCVNVMTGSAAEAADWVAYCNAPPDRGAGALRAAHGHPEPFAVRYFELDNETYRKYGALEYAHRCSDFARAMKAADPTIQLVMVGYWRYREFLPQMLEIAGPWIDLITDRGLEEEYLRGVLSTLRDSNTRSGRRIRLCNTEWLAPWGDVPVIPDALNRQPTDSELTLQNRQIRWRYAMNAARQLLVFQRLGGDFLFASFNNLANTWGQNVIECPKEDCYLSATGRVFELLSRSPAAWPLALRGTLPAGLVVQAAWNLERSALAVVVLNYRETQESVVLDLEELALEGPLTLEATVLHAPSPASFNTLAEPETIRTWPGDAGRISAQSLHLQAPPYSLLHAVVSRR